LKINLVVSGSDISAPLERLFLERLLLLSLLLLDVIPVVAAGVLFENVDSIFCDFQMKKTNDFVAGSFQICCLLWKNERSLSIVGESFRSVAVSTINNNKLADINRNATIGISRPFKIGFYLWNTDDAAVFMSWYCQIYEDSNSLLNWLSCKNDSNLPNTIWIRRKVQISSLIVFLLSLLDRWINCLDCPKEDF